MENKLWNKVENLKVYQDNQELYQNHILEQYKLYVEMADRISSRRNLANVFFLTLNSTIVTVIGFLFEKLNIVEPKWLLVFPLTCVLIFCVVWWWLIRSYRNINSAKYKVIGQMEQYLPSSPYWSAEWHELGEGNDIKKYLPLTVIENFVPVVFAIIYVLVSIYIFCFI